MTFPKSITFLGYYHRYNLGDETFKLAFDHLIAKVPELECSVVRYLNTDDTKVLPEDTDVVVCGGGDIFNSYFLDKIHFILRQSNWFTGPVIALSVGMPEPWMIRLGKIDIFDKIVCRSPEDAEILSQRIGKEHVMYIPDVTCCLFDSPTLVEPSNTVNIGLFLAQPIFIDQSPFRQTDRNIVDLMQQIKNWLTKEIGFSDVVFHLASFNVDPNNVKENDHHINKKLEAMIPSSLSVKVYQNDMNFKEMRCLIDAMDACICMRFHAHVFSFMQCKPVLSLNVTPKVTKLCQSLNYDYVVTLRKTENGNEVPSIDVDDAMYKFGRLWMDRKNVFQTLCDQSQQLIGQCQSYLTIFKAMTDRPSMKRTRWPSTKPKPNPEMERVKIVTLMLEYLNTRCNSTTKKIDVVRSAKQVANDETNFFHLTGRWDNTEQEMSDIAHHLARMVCFAITKTSFPKYHWGLSEQIFDPDFKFKASWNWLIDDYSKQEDNPNNRMKQQLDDVISNLSLTEDDIRSMPKVDLMQVEQLDYAGVHRSGWQYVVNHLLPLHSDDADVILDTYLDKTFGWCASFYKSMGILPFKKSWMGFIHHTFAVDYSDNNAYALLHSPLFIESLPYCKKIFVLSDDLRVKVENELKAIIGEGQSVPLVVTLFHPTEFVENDYMFTLDKFVINDDKKLIQVGAWLRDAYGIYRVPIDDEYKNPMKVKKAVLQGKSMENYFRPRRANLVLTLDSESQETAAKVSRCGCRCTCRTTPAVTMDDLCPCDRESVPNKWVHGLLESIESTYQDVTIISHLKNDEYDQLLCRNIVFLHLKDASAANTIIECIVRNTPVLVNPLPPVVEYLGQDYPFYYRSFREAADKATDIATISAAHRHLASMNKEMLDIRSFFRSMSTALGAV
uniref:Polysaccharide pyruvyl transferase n=1 Tax=Clandestinovirus TaxID=2831644 RepID=A0A8F8PQQ6_9VIRU|nr:polysaccharide pyruvyl transferase [Clandestinovirus]